MTNEQILKREIVLTAMYYQQPMPNEIVQMYFDDLADLPIESVMAVYRAYRRDPANTRPPLPAVIRAKVNPQDSPIDAARLAEAEIWEGISRFGYARPDDAEKHLGSLAWEGVKRSGGWASVCMASNDNSTTFRAQMRGLLESLHRRAADGRLAQSVALPQPRGVKPVHEIIARLAGPSGFGLDTEPKK